jgi:uracil phosphoribosyltransferase
MHTLIRDRDIATPDFVFYSDRLIRLVVEHGLGHLPFTEKQIVTPTGALLVPLYFAPIYFCSWNLPYINPLAYASQKKKK